MPGCVLPENGEVIAVSSCDECDKIYNGGCLQDQSSGPTFKVTFCFIRNVLVRTLSDVLVDIGSSQRIAPSVVRHVSIGSLDEGKPVSGDPLPLTADLRASLTTKITGGIAQLASTYLSTIHFRDLVLLKCARGKELKALYDRNLSDLYHLTAADLSIFHDAATTWFSLHPFVEAMVDVARDPQGSKHQTVRLTPDVLEKCISLIRRFIKASPSVEFRHDLESVHDELKGYKNLGAAEALSKLYATKAPSND
jgi:hypothetical protein